MKQMLVVLDYYKENPPTDQDIQKQLEIVTNFLRNDLRILDKAHDLKFHNFDAMKNCLKDYGQYLGNWTEAPTGFKKLVHFLQQSSYEEEGREILSAFHGLKINFMTKSIEINTNA